MRAVLISIQPKWCELNIKAPFRCYIYCTKDKRYFLNDGKRRLNGMVIGEFICNKVDRIQKRGINNNFDYCYLSLNVFGNDDIEIEITDIKKSCVKKEELNSYGANSNMLYAWHISNLVIYDKPKELGEFYSKCNEGCEDCNLWQNVRVNAEEFDMDCASKYYGHIPLKRPPQSWCYVKSVAMQC